MWNFTSQVRPSARRIDTAIAGKQKQYLVTTGTDASRPGTIKLPQFSVLIQVIQVLFHNLQTRSSDALHSYPPTVI